MTEGDLTFIESCYRNGLILGPVLELGGGYGGATCRDFLVSNGMQYFSTDAALSSVGEVDYIADFESGEGVDAIIAGGPWKTVLVLNVLEHTFAPSAVLDNVVRVLDGSGVIITATPCVWPIHSFPMDYCRLLPDWYRKYGERAGLRLLEDHFVFIGYGPISAWREGSTDCLPRDARMFGAAGLRSRIVHRIFNTYGRGALFRPHISIGAVYRKAS